MGKSKFVNANKKIEEKVVGTFKEIEILLSAVIQKLRTLLLIVILQKKEKL